MHDRIVREFVKNVIDPIDQFLHGANRGDIHRAFDMSLEEKNQ